MRDFVRVSVGGATRYRATGDFTVTIVHDAVYEDNEALTMTLALSDASIPYLLLGEAVATVTIVDNCADVDIWCATGTLGSEVHGEGRYDLYTGEVDNMEFRHNGADYRLLSIAMHQNGPNAGNVVLPFGIPERTEFLIDFLNLSGPSDQAFDPPNNDWLDWALHVYTISDGETLTATLTFSEAREIGRSLVAVVGRGHRRSAPRLEDGPTLQAQAGGGPKVGADAAAAESAPVPACPGGGQHDPDVAAMAHTPDQA